MRRATLFVLFVVLLVMQSVAVSALTASEARAAWIDAKQVSREKQQTHRDAKVDFAADRSEENRQAVVDTGKDTLYAALDEAEAWLIWKDIGAQENSELPAELRDTIRADVGANLGTIVELRADVDGIENQVQLTLVFLKMVGKYTELLTDVARDSGKILVHVGNVRLDTADSYEAKLRQAALGMQGNAAVLAELDIARSDLDEARRNVEKAESSYGLVVLPGTPLIKFAEGNNYLRTARANLLSAHTHLNRAYGMMVRGG